MDEVRVGQVTTPETLKGVCDGIDIVFSSVGITKQKDGLTFRDVDYQGKPLFEDENEAGDSASTQVDLSAEPLDASGEIEVEQ